VVIFADVTVPVRMLLPSVTDPVSLLTDISTPVEVELGKISRKSVLSTEVSNLIIELYTSTELVDRRGAELQPVGPPGE